MGEAVGKVGSLQVNGTPPHGGGIILVQERPGDFLQGLFSHFTGWPQVICIVSGSLEYVAEKPPGRTAQKRALQGYGKLQTERKFIAAGFLEEHPPEPGQPAEVAYSLFQNQLT